MAKTRKGRARQVRVITKHRYLTPREWGKVCSAPWTPATRPLIGALFAGNGGFVTVDADTACEGSWSRVMQANRLFIRHGLPFRIRGYELADAAERYRKSGYWISRIGLHLHTVTEML